MRQLKAEMVAIIAASGVTAAWLIIVLIFTVFLEGAILWWMQVVLLLLATGLLTLNMVSMYSINKFSHDEIIERLKAEVEPNWKLIKLMEEAAEGHASAAESYSKAIEARTRMDLLAMIEKQSEKMVKDLQKGADKYLNSKEVKKRMKAIVKERGEKIMEETFDGIIKRWEE